jgi:hypothetical protein
MLSLQQLSLSYAPAAALTTPRTAARAVPQMANTAEDLETLAKELNPVVGYWDPLGIGKIAKSIDADEQATIGWWRHAEIKHGRVAMAAFVGFCVQSNGIHFPWATTLSGMTYADIAAAGSPPAQWDAVPTNAKWQIFGLIAGLELWSECAMDKHYMKGGKPGAFPSFAPIREEIGHPTLDLFDPFGLSKNATPEKKEKGLLIEINNGRLAMLGIMAFVSEARVPGSVPGLANANIASYSGEVMAPWGPGDTSVLYVDKMLEYGATLFK